jgi:hypothetical protein
LGLALTRGYGGIAFPKNLQSADKQRKHNADGRKSD